LADLGGELGWPIFMKGTRQTSYHQRSLSIIENKEQFEQISAAYSKDPILRHQGVVCREFLQLRPVEDLFPGRIPSSFEFRTFWWRGQLAGLGRYWWDSKYYRMTKEEEVACMDVAGEAARRLKVPFLVIDLAQLVNGRWVVIECNDGQESGYAGISPLALWQRIIDIEHQFFGM
jgi:ATP-grasp domain-containing protein